MATVRVVVVEKARRRGVSGKAARTGARVRAGIVVVRRVRRSPVRDGAGAGREILVVGRL